MKERFWNVYYIVMIFLLIGGPFYGTLLSGLGLMNGWLSLYEADLWQSRGIWMFVIGVSMMVIRYIFLGKFER